MKPLTSFKVNALCHEGVHAASYSIISILDQTTPIKSLQSVSAATPTQSEEYTS